MSALAAGQLARLSQWIDDHNKHRDEEAQVWGRISKVGEEFGEVVAAMIAWTGQNPRKPRAQNGIEALRKELLDTAVAALAAYEHLSDNRGMAMQMLDEHIDMLMTRAGLQPPD